MYITFCLECQKVKEEHNHPASLLHPFPILEWKLYVLTIYFITKFSRTHKKHDSIMVAVDKLKNSTHFVLVQSTFEVTKIASFYIKEISRLHGISKAIISYRDPKLTSNFCKGLFMDFGI